jgi:hypothetical protein
MSGPTLPAGFEDLARFVGSWALPSERERMLARVHDPMDAISDFYKTLSPRITAVLTHLEAYPPKLEALPQPEQRLAMLALSFMECSRIFEMCNKLVVPCANFVPVRGDFGPLGTPG